MKTLHIWGDSEGILIEPEEIENRVDCGDGVLLVEGVTEVQEKSIYQAFEHAFSQDRRLHNADDVEAFLEEIGVKGEVGWSKEFEEVRNVLAFDVHNQGFFDLADGLEVSVFEYWDGSNHRVIHLTETMSESIVEVSDTAVSLDEWDGRNHVTGGMGYHQRVYRVFTEDGVAPTEPLYLIEEWSQWQGDLPQGKVVDESGLRIHLKELGRDVEKYMDDIKSQTGGR